MIEHFYFTQNKCKFELILNKNYRIFFHKASIFSSFFHLNSLSIPEPFQTVFHGLSGNSLWNVSASRDLDSGFLALPNSNRVSLEGVRSGVWVGVSFVLGDFHTFDEFSEGSSVPGSVFTDDSPM